MNDELILEEQDRQKLDGIVEKMVANGEADSDIEFVVNDFKTKYGKPLEVKKKDQTTPSTESVSEDAELVTEEQPTDGGAESGTLKADGGNGIEGVDKFTLPENFGEQSDLPDFDPQKEVDALGVEEAKNQRLMREGSRAISAEKEEFEKRIQQTPPEELRQALEITEEEFGKTKEDVGLILQNVKQQKADLDAFQQQIDPSNKQMVDDYNAMAQNYQEVLVPQLQSALDEYEDKRQAVENLSYENYVKRAQTGTFVGAATKQAQSGVTGLIDGFARLGWMGLKAMDRLDNIATFGATGIAIDEETDKKVNEEFLDKIKPVMEVNWLLQGVVNGDYLQRQAALTTPDNVERRMEDVSLESAALMAAHSAPMMLGGHAGMIAGYTSMGADMINNAPNSDQLSQDEKDAYALTIGVVSGTLERVGLQAMTGQGTGRVAQIANKYIAETITRGGKVTLSGAEKYALGVLRGGSAEGLITGTQEVVAITAENTINEIKGKEIFDIQEVSEYGDRLAHALGMGMATGGLMTSGFAMMSKSARFNPEEYMKAESTMNAGALADVMKYTEAKVESGAMTEEQGDVIMSETKRFTEIASQIPESLPLEQRAQAFDLLKEKSELEAEIEGKDKNLTVRQQERISEINSELQNIVAPQETTEQTDAQKETKEGENVQVREVPVQEEVRQQPDETAQEVRVEADAQLELDFDTEIETATEQQLNEINETYEGLEAETDVASTEGEIQTDEAVEAEQESEPTKRNVGTEITEESLPKATDVGASSQIAVTDNVDARVKVIELPDGDTGYAVEIYKDGELVADKDGDTQVEFSNDEAAEIIDHLNKKQRGFILAKQPKGKRKAKETTGEIPKGTRVKFNVFGNPKEGIVGEGGSITTLDGKYYVAPMVSDVQVSPEPAPKKKVSPKPDKSGEKVSVKPDENVTKPKSEPKAPKTDTNEVVAKEKFESAFTKGAKDADAMLADLENQLKKFSDGTLGMNLPVAVAQVAIKAARAAVKTAKTASQVVDAAINAIKETDWYKGLNSGEKAAAVKATGSLFSGEKAKVTKVDTVKSEIQGGLSPLDAVRQGFKEFNEAVLKPLQKEVKSLRGKLDRMKAADLNAKDFKKTQMAQALAIIKEGVDNNLISSRTFNALNRRLATARTKGDFSKMFDYIDKAINESTKKAYDRGLKKLIAMTKPNKLTELRQSGQRKGKLNNHERIAIQSVHNALKSNDIEGISSRLKELQQKIDDGTATESNYAEFDGLVIARNALINGVNGIDIAVNEIKQLLKEGRSKLREETKKKAETRRENAEKATETVSGGKGLPKAGSMAEKAAREASKGFFKRMFQTVDGFFDIQASLRMLVDKIDRMSRTDGAFGLLDKLLYEPIANARRKKDTLQLELEEKIMSAQEKIYGSTRKAAKAVNKRNEQKKIGTFVKLDGKEETLVLSENQAIQAYNMRKNPRNDATFEEMGWTQEMHDAVANSISENGKKWADWQVDVFYPYMHEKINEVYKRMNYMDLPMQENYVPVKRSGVAEGKEETASSGPNAFVNDLISVGYGSLKERVGSTQPFDISTSADAVMYQYMLGMNHYISFAEAIKEVNAITGNKTFRNAVKLFNGVNTMKALDSFVAGLAAEGNKELDVMNIFAKFARLHTTSKLAISPIISIKQLTSTPAYMADIGVRNFVRETTRALANPAKSAREIKNIFKQSSYLRMRYRKGFDRDMMSAMARNEKQFFSGKSTLLGKLMFNVKYGDAGAILMGYGVYKHYLKNAPKNLTAKGKEQYAIEKFEEATKLSQQSSNTEDQNYIQRGSAFQKLFTMYQTSPIMYMNQERKAVRDMYRGVQQGNMKQVKDGARRFVIYHMVLPGIFQYVANGLPGLLLDWDDDDEKDILRSIALGSLNGIFIAGDIGKWIVDLVAEKPWAFGGPSFSPAAGDVIKLTKAIVKETEEISKTEDNYTAAILESLAEVGLEGGDLTGLPVQRVKKTYDAFDEADNKWDEYSDQEKAAVILGISPKYIEYKNKGKKKKKDSDNEMELMEFELEDIELEELEIE